MSKLQMPELTRFKAALHTTVSAACVLPGGASKEESRGARNAGETNDRAVTLEMSQWDSGVLRVIPQETAEPYRQSRTD
jgi:hypothetical protein